MTTTIFVVAPLLLAVGCGPSTPAGDGDGGPPRCDFDTDCNDSLDCTIDSCGVGNVCAFTPLSERCAMGETCVPGRGCISGTTCMTTADCDDMIPCTLDSCGVGGTCRHMPLPERCTDPAMPECDATMGCVAGSGCRMDMDCDDDIPCTIDACGVDLRCTHEAVDERCNTAGGEVCTLGLGCRVPMGCANAAECQDGNFCNGAEECMPEFGCAPPTAPRMCNDSNTCTNDSCDPAVGEGGACVFACDPTLGTECAAMCPPGGPSCVGTFNVSGDARYMCSAIFAGIPIATVVNVDFSQLTFTADAGGRFTVRPRSSHFAAPLQSDIGMAAMCPNFNVVATVSGGCEENYRISGTFTDDDSFAGMLSISFVDSDGSCAMTDCVGRTAMITATRAP